MDDKRAEAARLRIQELRTRQPKKDQRSTAKKIVNELYAEIEAAIDEGQSLDDIVDCLRKSDVQITIPTLRTYLCRLRTSRNRRKRNSKKPKSRANEETRLAVSVPLPNHPPTESGSEKLMKEVAVTVSEPDRDITVAEAVKRIKAQIEERKKVVRPSSPQPGPEQEDWLAADIARMEEARAKRPRGSFEIRPDTPNL